MLSGFLSRGKFTEKDTLVLEAIAATIVKSKPEDVHYEIISFLYLILMPMNVTICCQSWKY
jgi:hypothetical protein